MKAYTVHLKPGATPILVPEAFSWAAAVFGPAWLLAHRAWIPGGLWFALAVIAVVLAPPPARPVVALALAWLAGLLGQDLRRWSLEHRGYTTAHVLAARDKEAALGRLILARPDLVPALAGRLP